MFKIIFKNIKIFFRKLFARDQMMDREQYDTPINDSIQSSIQSNKTFRIIAEKKIEKPILPNDSRTRKTFKIKSELQIETNPNPIGQFDDSEGSFRINSQTRPKKCIQCLTENKITKLDSGEWQCTECGYTWD